MNALFHRRLKRWFFYYYDRGSRWFPQKRLGPVRRISRHLPQPDNQPQPHRDPRRGDQQRMEAETM
jgi:hypothetical protein